jgi:hypothetical protein
MIPPQTDFCRYFSRFFVQVFADFCRFGRIGSDRFFAVFDGLCRSALGAHHSLVAVGAACSAAKPNLLGEVLPLFLGGGVDDLPAGVVRASGMVQDGLGVLRERVGSGVVLRRLNSPSGACQPDAFGDVARRT